jgi:hypothetical protein
MAMAFKSSLQRDLIQMAMHSTPMSTMIVSLVYLIEVSTMMNVALMREAHLESEAS